MKRNYCTKHNLLYNRECTDCFADRKLKEKIAQREYLASLKPKPPKENVSPCENGEFCVWLRAEGHKGVCTAGACVKRDGWVAEHLETVRQICGSSS